ncbi:MAG: hypothetical protein ACE5EW_01280 [Thermoplasmata archaeon]
MRIAKISLVPVLLMVISAFATAVAPPGGDLAGTSAMPSIGSSSVNSITGSIAAADSSGGLPASPSIGGLPAVAAATSTGKSVLIYGPSMGALLAPPWDYNEETIAAALGHSVTVVTAQVWFGMTAAEFAAFDAIVFGDPKCEAAGSLGTVLLEPANVTKAAWSPAITGPTIVIGTTPQFYQFNPNLEDRELIANGIEFAASGPGTGLYVSLSCYFLTAPSMTQVEFLSEVGEFRVGGRAGCTDPVTIVDPTHPAMLGLTTLGQPDWGCASQEIITGFPASLDVLATAVRSGFALPFVVASPIEASAEPPVDPPIDPPIDPTDPAFYDLWAEIEVEDDEVEVEGGFTLGTDSNGIDPMNEDVTVEIGAYSFTIPKGSFALDDDEEWEFERVIDGVEVEMEIELVGDKTYEFEFEVEGTYMDGLENPVEISLTIGDDSGTTIATADWDDDHDDEKDDDDDDDDEDDDDEDD